jgi:hypothetical protein
VLEKLEALKPERPELADSGTALTLGDAEVKELARAMRRETLPRQWWEAAGAADNGDAPSPWPVITALAMSTILVFILSVVLGDDFKNGSKTVGAPMAIGGSILVVVALIIKGDTRVYGLAQTIEALGVAVTLIGILLLEGAHMTRSGLSASELSYCCSGSCCGVRSVAPSRSEGGWSALFCVWSV